LNYINMSNKLILSVYYGEHDSCITFADEKEILLHLEAERYFRKKHIRVTPKQMEELVAVGLEYLGQSIENVEKVFLSPWGGEDFYLGKINFLGRSFTPIITSHHLSHIGAILPANMDDALIVCADGGSEDGSTKFYLKQLNELVCLADLDETILTGKFYGSLTQIIVNPNFYEAHSEAPGRTMGLAALGSFSQEFYDLIMANKKLFCFLYQGGCSHLNRIFGISNNFNEIWKDKRRRDLAFTAQKIWIDEFVKKISEYRHLSQNICLVGGCALNVVLSTELARKKWFKNVVVSPVSGDCGQSLGAILYHFPRIRCNYSFLGRGFGEMKESKNLISDVVNDLLENKIVAWYQGRSGIGARALGHRSLLGLPDSIEMRIKLSEKIKGREPYRPISAVIAQEFLPEFTEEIIDSPFMTFAPKVKENIKKVLPAIVHNDGTCRIQTLDKNDNEILYDILREIGEKTDYPVLMNSSLNVAGEPIVDTPEDAIKTFKKCDANVLYINGARYEKIWFIIMGIVNIFQLFSDWQDAPIDFLV
jgi:carbamoyltransferase